MLKRNRYPQALRISIQKPVLILSFELISLLCNGMQVRFKNERPVLIDPKGETAVLLGLPPRDDVLPSDGDALEDVDELVIAGQAEGE